MQRARDWRCGQRKNVDFQSKMLQAVFDFHAELLLFVDDQQAKIFELDVFLYKPVRSDDDVDFALCQLFDGYFLFAS